MKDIMHNNERVGVRGRFAIGDDGFELRSLGPDLRTIGLVPGQWIAAFGDSFHCLVQARVTRAPQTAESVRLSHPCWMPPSSDGVSDALARGDYSLWNREQEEKKRIAQIILSERGELSLYISRPPISTDDRQFARRS